MGDPQHCVGDGALVSKRAHAAQHRLVDPSAPNAHHSSQLYGSDACGMCGRSDVRVQLAQLSVGRCVGKSDDSKHVQSSQARRRLGMPKVGLVGAHDQRRERGTYGADEGAHRGSFYRIAQCGT